MVRENNPIPPHLSGPVHLSSPPSPRLRSDRHRTSRRTDSPGSSCSLRGESAPVCRQPWLIIRCRLSEWKLDNWTIFKNGWWWCQTDNFTPSRETDRPTRCCQTGDHFYNVDWLLPHFLVFRSNDIPLKYCFLHQWQRWASGAGTVSDLHTVHCALLTFIVFRY